MNSGMEDLKRRLEVLLPTQAAIDESQRRKVEEEARLLSERKAKVAEASGTLVTAALSLAGELVSGSKDSSPSEETVDRLTEKLNQCVDRDEQGRPQLKISLADESALKNLARNLASLLE